MAKVKKKLMTQLCVGTKIVGRSKKFSRDTLSWVGSDNRGIVTGFYGKEQEHITGIKLCPNSYVYWSHG